MTSQDINAKYPVRNSVWTFDLMTARWTSEASALGGEAGKNLDPWNRPMLPICRELRDIGEGDLLGWVYESSVEQSLVELVVYND